MNGRALVQGHPHPSRRAALMHPETYGLNAGTPIGVIDTTMNCVFLTPEHAYKLKTPQFDSDFDAPALAQRRRNCALEVRLNRRLATGVYQGVSLLCARPDGALRIDTSGRPVDCLVRMQRLPHTATLEAHIATDQPPDPSAVLEPLLALYATAPRLRQPSGYPLALQNRVRRLYHALQGVHSLVAAPDTVRLVAEFEHQVTQCGSEMVERASAGRVVEGHGDLRPEHVYLLKHRVSIIDCLEFDRALRMVDPADEIGFLALECSRLEADDFASGLLDSYLRASGDRPTTRLLRLYRAHRALLWACLALRHLRTPGPTLSSAAWVVRAEGYLAAAEKALTGRWKPP